MNHERALGAAFLAGVVTVSSLLSLLLAFTGWRVGFRELGRHALEVAVPEPDEHGLPALSPALVEELTVLGAVLDNAENLTGAKDHDGLLVRPDERRIYALRANARIDAFVLASERALNLDPPVVYLSQGSPLSPGLRDYLRRHTRLRYSASVDSQGFRSTLPAVVSERKVLLVGDSVVFGVGVGDQNTMASALQELVGESLQVVNAGVGEYGPEEVYRTADALSSAGNYLALVYVACHNDFVDEPGPGERGMERARPMLQRLAALAPRFDRRVMVLLATPLEYTASDVLGEKGWPPERHAEMDRLRDGLRPVARDLGFAYADWAELLAESPQQDGSLFYRFAYYADHVHLSPLGNRLAARELHRALARWGLVGA